MLEHGGRLREAALKYGIPEKDWLDLSSGIAPWSWPIPDISPRAWTRLPESDDGLEKAACDYYGAPQLLPVPGSQAAIQRCHGCAAWAKWGCCHRVMPSTPTPGAVMVLWFVKYRNTKSSSFSTT